MTLIDTGPIVALIDKGQEELHGKCVAVSQALVGPLLTTWPCFTEAMYFLHRLRGWQGQATLWRFIAEGALMLHTPGESEWPRMHSLMEKYQDTPMDLADASLVVAAESRGMKSIFTLDSDFYIYRINDIGPFEVVPLS
ncbi:MAG: PIN domain-containing protein [Acidobacteriota bacterium]|nr:PIN domain-containing protein [Acidobacteriota bacterium]